MMIMKKIFNSIFVIIAAMVAFAGCAKENAIAPGETKKVQFFAENIETKTHFGDKNDENKYPTLWDADDKVKVLLNLESPTSIKNLEKTVEIEVSEDSKSARFVADLNSEYEFDSYTFYAVSPYSAYNAKSSKEGRFTVQIPEAQNPQVTSVDENAQVLYAVSATTDMFPSSVKLNFKHFTAYGKFSLTNLTDKVNTISSVKLSFEEKVVGKWNYFVEDGSIAAKDATCEIVLTPTSTEDIWFACAPVDMSGKTLTLSVATDKGDLVKNITFPANRKFEAGKIANFTVDMKGIEVAETDEPDQPEESADVWSLVTDVANLVVGDKIVIAAATDEYEYALSITQNNNNRASVAIKKENSVIAINDDVQVITIEEGKVENTFAFNVGSGYLYAASSSSNHLKTKDELDANGSWLIEISTTGVATIKAQGANTRNWLRFNASNNPKIFSCYGSGQTDVAIYRLEGGSEEGGEMPEEPETPAEPTQLQMSDITCSAQTENSLTFTWSAVANATGYEVTCNGNTETVTATEYTATGLTAGTQYSVSIKAVGDGVDYITSAAATCSETTLQQEVGGPETPEEPEQPESTPKFVKVTSAPTDWSGTYLIVYEAGKVAFNGSSTTLDVAKNTQSVTISDNQIEATDAMMAITFTIAKSGSNYTVKSKSGYYVGQTSNANGLKSSTSTTYANTLSFNTSDSSVNFVSGSAYLRFNAAATDMRFRYYKSSTYTGQKAIHLYKLQD